MADRHRLVSHPLNLHSGLIWVDLLELKRKGAQAYLTAIIIMIIKQGKLVPNRDLVHYKNEVLEIGQFCKVIFFISISKPIRKAIYYNNILGFSL